MFSPIPNPLNLTLLEEDVLHFWRRERIYAKAHAQRQGGPQFVFYEGPPSTGRAPGAHHLLALACKDAFLRYKTMNGYEVLRRAGWSTHGLPVEVEVEKRLGIRSKSQIEAYGIERFNQLCRKTAFNYIQDWERLTERIGFWVDLEEAYVTFTNDYIESLWWVLKTFWDRGQLYQAEAATPYCPRCATTISDHEAVQGLAEVDDPCIYFRLPLVDELGTSLLVWTSTAWTLPGNVAVAVNPDAEYVKVERPLEEGGTEQLILSAARLEAVFPGEPVRVVERFKGRRLKGRRYRPLFTFLLPHKPAYFVVSEGSVRDSSGTGLAQLSPEFGPRELKAAQDHDLPRLKTVGPDGAFLPEVRPFSGRAVKEAEAHIVRDLEARGLLLRAEAAQHKSPHCPHCATRLTQYVRPAWFLRTSAFRDQMMAHNRTIRWRPERLQEGRFGKGLESLSDWALGRERYWGAPLPIWECDVCHHRLCIGSVSELEQLAGQDLSRLDLHRPGIDEVRFPCPECGPAGGDGMRRVPDVLDAGFDSGAMPVAQWHYPFENTQNYQDQFPADFICETVDETRGWFYTLHATGTLLFDGPAFRNATGLGLSLDEDGRKPSSADGSRTNPGETIDQHGADAVRWHLFTAAPSSYDRRLSIERLDSGAESAARSLALPLWNACAFFAAHASRVGWKPGLHPASSDTEQTAGGEALDRWLLSQLHSLVGEVTAALEDYDITRATRPVQKFVSDLSKWYLRRSRCRFSPLASEADRQSALASLYDTLVVLCKLVAPAIPFLAEELYQRLVRPVDPAAPESIHLTDWPKANESLIDPLLHAEMRMVRELASLGHAARHLAGIPVRQPLAEAAFSAGSLHENRLVEKYTALLTDELNVEQVRVLGWQGEALTYHLHSLPGILGSKHKALYLPLSLALQGLDREGAGRALLSGRSLMVSLAGKAYTILPEDVRVRVEASDGFVCAYRGACTAALKVEKSPHLEQAGLAREITHHLQRLRRKAGLGWDERIHAYFEGSPRLQQAVEAHRAEILAQTRADSLDRRSEEDLPEAHRVTFQSGGETAAVAFALAAT